MTGKILDRGSVHFSLSSYKSAGVLKGDKARFQLFGDTVNTASRLETTGLPGMIQISEETANRLKKAGKDDWYMPRKETIVAKGKGKIRTFWLDLSSTAGLPLRLGDQEKQQDEERLARMILWVTEALTSILKQIHGQRQNRKTEAERKLSLSSSAFRPQGETVLDEVCEVIDMPSFCGQEAIDPEEIDLYPKVTEQLETFVRRIAALCKYDDSIQNTNALSYASFFRSEQPVSQLRAVSTQDSQILCFILRHFFARFSVQPM